MTDIDIAKLAALSRIAISQEEQKELEREIPDILSFVEQITDAGGAATKNVGHHYNVLRDDTEPHESGAYTPELLAEMPETKGNYLKVRKIISHDS